MQPEPSPSSASIPQPGASPEPLVQLQARLLARVAPGTKTRRLSWSGGSFGVLELGEGDPVVFVHGGFGDAFQIAQIMPALAANRRVIAIDRPGMGLADPFDYRGVDVLAHGRQYLHEAFDALGLERAAVFANSMGGLWSIAFALAEPERVTRLALVGAPAGFKRRVPVQLAAMRWPIFGALIRRMMARPTRDSTRAFWKQIIVAHPERLSDELLDAVTESQRRNIDSWMSFAAAILDVRGLRPEIFVRDQWASLAPPVRLVWGDRDAFGPPSEAHALAAKLPTADVVEIPDAGHLPWLDDPAAVVAALRDFL